MPSLQYLRVSKKADECLRRYYSDTEYDEVSFKLGTILLLIMKMAPLLKQQPPPVDVYREELRGVYEKNKDLHELFDFYLWSLNDIYFQDDDEYCYFWNNQRKQLQNVYGYVSLCMDNPKFYTTDNLHLLTSRMVRDYSPPVLRNETIDFENGHTEEYSARELKSLFQDSGRQKLTYMYDCSDLLHICLASIHELISSKPKLRIKKCEICGDWFIAYKKNSKYCSEQCQEAGREVKEGARLSDELEKKIRRYREAVRKECVKKKNMKERDDFSEAVIDWRKKIKSTEATKEEFDLWLDSWFESYRERTRKS